MSDRNRVVVEAPCKINLSLDIVGADDQGYHLLETVMQTVGLCDVLVISRRREGGIRVSCTRPDLPTDSSNIAHQAAGAFFAALGLAGQGLFIHIDKSIPVQAGLAGGSADAAAVLVGLNHLYGGALSREKLLEIGAGVGSDVPFCIRGGCMLAEGRGERMSPLNPLPPCRVALAKPPVGMSTQQAYRSYDSAGELSHPKTAAMLDAIAARDLDRIGGAMENIFERLGPPDEVGMLKELMLGGGASGAVMSGSGTAVVGLFSSKQGGEACLRRLRQRVADAWLVQPVDHGAQIIHAG